MFGGVPWHKTRPKGFTLIELSVTLVIIGLIVGGVLVGQDLIHAAVVRSTVSQIDKYNMAANTFRDKYGYLPGDIRDPDATHFGFRARGQFAGEGDGNGMIEGVQTNSAGSNEGYAEGRGETVMFWVDVSGAGLMEGTFTKASPTSSPSPVTIVGTALDSYFPAAKVGNGNYIYVWSGGINTLTSSNGINYFGLSNIIQINNGYAPNLSPGLSIAQAFAMDQKVDDGLPQSGRVTAMIPNTTNGQGARWVSGDPMAHSPGLYWGAAPGSVAAPSSLSCYDNQGVSTNQMQYSVAVNSGTGMNCALSFQFH